MPLALQADVEKIGQVDFSNEPEDAVTLWIAAATKAIEQFCGRLFEETSGATATLDGRFQSTIHLDGYPITAINSLTEETIALTNLTDFFWYPDGRLIRVSEGLYDIPWSALRRSVAVDYDYGWAVADVPDDLRYVCAAMALRIFRAGEAWANSPAGVSGALTSLQLDGSGSASWEGAGGEPVGNVPLLSGVDRDILNKYRRRI